MPSVPALDPRPQPTFASRTRALALGCVFALFVAAAVSAQQTTVPAAPQVADAWPHELKTQNGTVTVFQPQATSWPERKRLTVRAALSIQKKGESAPLMGTVELAFNTTVDEAAGVVNLSDPHLNSSHFPALDTQQAAALEAKIRDYLPQMQLHQVPLANVLLSLKQLPVAPVKVNNDPPVIFYSDAPASLVVFDGDPVMVPAGKSALTYAVNTNWGIFSDQGKYYLLNNGYWFAADTAAGPYQPVALLPVPFQALKKDPNFASAAKFIPAKPWPAKNPVPKIFVSQKPAEIIITAGAPQMRSVTGTSLQRVVNTPNGLFFYPAQNLYYVQLSGRWFSAKALAGPWRFATDKLPPDFSLIPAKGADSAVLASVPGTIQAQEAVLQAQIPTTAAVSRSTAKVTVVYSGPPRFVPLTGTTMLYAVNTPAYVLKINNGYYACESGAWFVAATPTGPWLLADSVPQVVYSIPVTSPLYPVTYVRVYAVSPTVITFGYTAGYTMGYVSYGVMVYGTGFYYPPVIIPGPVPIFYPYPYTYAGSVWYNSSTGAWARGGTVYGPYGGAVSGGSYYNPNNGAWAHGGAVYGPNGGAGAWSAYNPSTGSYAHGSASWSNGSGTANASWYNGKTGRSGSTNQNVNPYGRWGSSTISGPNQTVNTQSQANANGRAGSFNSSTGAKGAGYQNAVTGGSGGAVKTQNGDVYAGHDGNVYKHTDNGWQKYDNGSWNNVQPTKPSGNNANNTNANNLKANNPNAGNSGNLGAAQQDGGNRRGGGSQGGGQIDRDNYQQLEQDRLGRQAGSGRFGGGGNRGNNSSGGFGGRNRR
jgi:hypothetical protein